MTEDEHFQAGSRMTHVSKLAGAAVIFILALAVIPSARCFAGVWFLILPQVPRG